MKRSFVLIFFIEPHTRRLTFEKSWANVKLDKIFKKCIIIHEIGGLFMDNIPYEVLTRLTTYSEVNSLAACYKLFHYSLCITADNIYTAEINLTTGSTADDCISAYL